MNHALQIPRRIDPASALMGMSLWLFSEAMFFAALISAYFVARSSSIAWPPLGQPRLPVLLTGLNTLVLLAGGWAVWSAAFGRNSGRDVARDRVLWLAALLTGIVFVLVQGYEWARLLNYGLGLTSGAYGSFFYLIIGTHALHALAGIAALAYALPPSDRPLENGGRAVALYWIFVVALWPVLYLLVYLV